MLLPGDMVMVVRAPFSIHTVSQYLPGQLVYQSNVYYNYLPMYNIYECLGIPSIPDSVFGMHLVFRSYPKSIVCCVLEIAPCKGVSLFNSTQCLLIGL